MTQPIEIGSTVSHYRILDKLGESGMGVVYKAEDTRLRRTVALRFLPPSVSGDRLERLLTDVRAAVALDQPNICTIHDVGEHDGHTYVVSGFVEGETLVARMAAGPLPTDTALDAAIQISQGLEAAHAEGAAYGILTPTNVMISPEGQVRMMDFGLARLSSEIAPPGPAASARTDIVSLCGLLRGLLAGEASLSKPESEYESVSQIRAELEELRDRSRVSVTGEMVTQELGRHLRRPRVWIPVVGVLLVTAGMVGWFLHQSSKARWARDVAIREVGRLVAQDRYLEAYSLAEQVEEIVPGDERLLDLWPVVSRHVSLVTDPPGADVSLTAYETDEAGRLELGATPLTNVRVPFGFYRWRVEKNGFETIEVAGEAGGVESRGLSGVARHDGKVPLTPIGEDPPGMIRLPSRLFDWFGVQIDEYLIDRYEVTNREFKEFIDAGGYRNRDYWKQPFLIGGKEIPWEEAMSRFVGHMGRHGPAAWEMGAYPEGEDDLPVRGVSWYEAAAYAEWAGKSLPTVAHWFRGWLGPIKNEGNYFNLIVRRSNIGGVENGPAPVGTYRGLTFTGTYDMAGNVKEWCWNNKGTGRAMMGGAWHEPPYILALVDAQDPFDRDESFGFRCVRYLSDAGPSPELLGALPAGGGSPPDFESVKPAADDIFEIYRSVYAYEKVEPDAVVEARVDRSRFHWREKVRFNSPIAGQRMLAYVYLPKTGQPPYQAVMFFLGGELRAYSSIEQRDFLDQKAAIFTRSGRAVVLPVYQGQFERRGTGRPFASDLDETISTFREFSATIDYLETRGDINAKRIGYHGQSTGARVAPILLTLESRVKAAIIVGGGLKEQDIADHEKNPEFSLLNFLPRFRVPVLMVAGSLDPIFPLEGSQRPFFRLIGTPDEHKRLAALETVHLPPLRADYIREQLDWLDKYLGPVE